MDCPLQAVMLLLLLLLLSHKATAACILIQKRRCYCSRLLWLLVAAGISGINSCMGVVAYLPIWIPAGQLLLKCGDRDCRLGRSLRWGSWQWGVIWV